MTANTNPIYSKLPIASWYGGAVVTGNTTDDMTSGTTYLVATAGADGDFYSRIQFVPLGTNVASVGRIWINNGSTTGTAANNTMVGEVSLPLTTGIETASITPIYFPMGYGIPGSYKIYVTIGTTVATGFHVQAIGGTY